MALADGEPSAGGHLEAEGAPELYAGASITAAQEGSTDQEKATEVANPVQQQSSSTSSWQSREPEEALPSPVDSWGQPPINPAGVVHTEADTDTWAWESGAEPEDVDPPSASPAAEALGAEVVDTARSELQPIERGSEDEERHSSAGDDSFRHFADSNHGSIGDASIGPNELPQAERHSEGEEAHDIEGDNGFGSFSSISGSTVQPNDKVSKSGDGNISFGAEPEDPSVLEEPAEAVEMQQPEAALSSPELAVAARQLIF